MIAITVQKFTITGGENHNYNYCIRKNGNHYVINYSTTTILLDHHSDLLHPCHNLKHSTGGFSTCLEVLASKLSITDCLLYLKTAHDVVPCANAWD